MNMNPSFLDLLLGYLFPLKRQGGRLRFCAEWLETGAFRYALRLVVVGATVYLVGQVVAHLGLAAFGNMLSSTAYGFAALSGLFFGAAIDGWRRR
ncbi:hypothetical protein [Thioalkalivibrio thiocyanodenitrificans]|uniref:hypothetical protein n=1 Tax=Thioalkalivibrio thiocyanodenitrificans TaxID=243063 RepID=UPI00035EA3B8|nr:hypothetical protein [Thioalkalivibrio thiocyanodenitrificans]